MKAKLTTGNEVKHLLNLSLPMMVGILAIFGFNLVDTYFVGQLGSTELAAISFTFPVVSILGSIAFGLGLGVTSLISRAIGRGDHEYVKEIATDGLSLAFLTITVVSVICYFNIDPIFRLLGASDELLPYIRDYMEIWFFTMLFVVVPMVGNGAIRATGNTKFPAIIMIAAGVINFILDPIMIFGLYGMPRMELQGAALATVISRFFSMCAAIFFLHYKLKMLTNPFRQFSSVLKNWRAILDLGIPGALNNAIIPLSLGFITRLVSAHGNDAVAGFGVATRIESFIMICIIGVAASLSPFIGQNWGAREFARIEKAMLTSNIFAFLWSIFAFGVFYIFSGPIVAAFSQSVAVQNVAKFYLEIMILTFIFAGIMLNINSSFNAIGRPKVSLVLTLIRIGILYVPLAYILDSFFSEKGIFVAGALANVLVGLGAMIVYKNKFFSSRTL